MKEYKIIYEEEKSKLWIVQGLLAFLFTWIILKSFNLLDLQANNLLEIWGIVGYFGMGFLTFIIWFDFFSGINKHYSEVPKYEEYFIKGKIKEIQEVKYPKEVKRKTKFKTIWRDEKTRNNKNDR